MKHRNATTTFPREDNASYGFKVYQWGENKEIFLLHYVIEYWLIFYLKSMVSEQITYG